MPSRRASNTYAKHGRIFEVPSHTKRRMENSTTIALLTITLTGAFLTFLLTGSGIFHN